MDFKFSILLFLLIFICGVNGVNESCIINTIETKYICFNGIVQLNIEYLTKTNNITQYLAEIISPSYFGNTTYDNFILGSGPINQTVYTNYNFTCPYFLDTTLELIIKLSSLNLTCESNIINITRCGNSKLDQNEECEISIPNIGGEICVECKCDNNTSYKGNCINDFGNTTLNLDLILGNEFINFSFGVNSIYLDYNKTLTTSKGTNITSQNNIYLYGDIIFNASGVDIGIYPIFTTKALLISNKINITNLGVGLCARSDYRGIEIGNEIISELHIDIYICNSQTTINGTCNLSIENETIYICDTSGNITINVSWDINIYSNSFDLQTILNTTNTRLFYQYNTLPPLYLGDFGLFNGTTYLVSCGNRFKKHSLVLTVTGGNKEIEYFSFYCKSNFYFTVCGNGYIDLGEECDYAITNATFCEKGCVCKYGLIDPNITGVCIEPPTEAPTITPYTNPTNYKYNTNTTNTNGPKTKNNGVNVLISAIILLTIIIIIVIFGIFVVMCKIRTKNNNK